MNRRRTVEATQFLTRLTFATCSVHLEIEQKKKKNTFFSLSFSVSVAEIRIYCACDFSLSKTKKNFPTSFLYPLFFFFFLHQSALSAIFIPRNRVQTENFFLAIQILRISVRDRCHDFFRHTCFFSINYSVKDEKFKKTTLKNINTAKG